MINYYVPERYMEEWRSICKRYCEVKGYTLIFINNESFGYSTKDEQFVHKYIDELAGELGQYL